MNDWYNYKTLPNLPPKHWWYFSKPTTHILDKTYVEMYISICEGPSNPVLRKIWGCEYHDGQRIVFAADATVEEIREMVQATAERAAKAYNEKNTALRRAELICQELQEDMR